MMNDEDISEVQATFRKLSSDLILSGVDPLMISGILTASGIRMYKDTMVREEFLQMMDIIYKEAINWYERNALTACLLYDYEP